MDETQCTSELFAEFESKNKEKYVQRCKFLYNLCVWEKDKINTNIKMCKKNINQCAINITACMFLQIFIIPRFLPHNDRFTPWIVGWLFITGGMQLGSATESLRYLISGSKNICKILEFQSKIIDNIKTYWAYLNSEECSYILEKINMSTLNHVFSILDKQTIDETILEMVKQPLKNVKINILVPLDWSGKNE